MNLSLHFALHELKPILEDFTIQTHWFPSGQVKVKVTSMDGQVELKSYNILCIMKMMTIGVKRSQQYQESRDLI